MKKQTKWMSMMLATGILLQPLGAAALTKNEMIYSNLDTDGSPYKTIISNHLTTFDQSELEDETELKNILNINGKEKFDLLGTKLTWHSSGHDIFYQGTIEKELPITTKIQYYLNGEEMKAKDLVGKKGSIKIVYTFDNQNVNTISVNGSNQTMYTPFLVTVGTMIDSKKNHNISVTNGKVVNTGNRSMIVALASPGLYESMGLEAFEEFGSITLTFDTDHFSMNNTYIVSTPKLIETKDLAIFKTMDQLYGNMSELQAKMNEIEAGANTLLEGTDHLVAGSSQLSTNLQAAVTAMEQLKAGSLELHAGMEQMVQALNNVKAALPSNDSGSMNQLNALKQANQKAITSLISKSGLSMEQLSSLYEQNQLKTYEGTDETLLAIKSTYELIALLTSNNTAIDTTIGTLTELSKQTTTLLTTLEGALDQLNTGSATLVNGLTQVTSGIHELYQGSVTLVTGTNTVKTGAETLTNGIRAYNNQGIKPLMGYVHVFKNYGDKAEALLDLSQNYQGFGSNNSTTSTFVSMVKAVK